ncbi:branched-chain amino acid ABC transporter permease [Neorhizobium alkalisoli]|uniref:Amino acid/amide ABC transporter membrane protein 2 (HAAT family) n=1 Tax=Neorhizobium alkalisoli TaxID=528178 RepID=A0A561R7F9_9HYPH|nr:branched-chain amino acid ABC transporter permease [Neorhizobium alkalisoli]TWF58532.1 amino acid/amide ABC transporter membrane protein 2 (HAAT family) [Neorhizobium alkalisoli]
MKKAELLCALAFLIVLGLLALVGLPGNILNLFIFMMIITLTAQGWNLLGGYGGLSSFGHAAFFGTGAYAMTVLQTSFGINAWVALVCGVALGALVGAFIGFLSFRAGLKGSYFALITLAFAEVLRILANSWDFTGGAAGMMIKLQNGFAYLQFSDRRYFFLILLVFVALALFLSRWLERSAFGAYLIALRENDQAAQALGVDIFRVKMQAITLSAGLTALAGCLYAQNFLFIDANVAYGSWISIEALFAAIVGGAGTLIGPLIGAVLLLGLGEVTKSFSGGIAGLDLVVFGIILVLCVAFAPNGIRGFFANLKRRRSAAAEAA